VPWRLLLPLLVLLPGAALAGPGAAPEQPRVFEPEGRRFEVLDGRLQLDVGPAGTTDGAVELAFIAAPGGSLDRVADAGEAVELVSDADLLQALLDSLEELASDLLGRDAGVGLLGVPRASVGSDASLARLRIAGSVEIDTGDRVREGEFLFTAQPPTAVPWSGLAGLDRSEAGPTSR
jgi:hypothetical protein